MLRMRDPALSVSRLLQLIGDCVPTMPARSDMQTKDMIVYATLSLGLSPEGSPPSLFYSRLAPRVLVGKGSLLEIGLETGTATIATRRGAHAQVVMDIDYVRVQVVGVHTERV